MVFLKAFHGKQAFQTAREKINLVKTRYICLLTLCSEKASFFRPEEHKMSKNVTAIENS